MKNSKFDSITVDDLNIEQAEIELERLASLISLHNINYYNYDSPKISDYEYDALWIRNQLIEKKFPTLVRSNSPSFSVGSLASGEFKKVKHIQPMLSLSNIFNENDLGDFYNQVIKLLELSKKDTIEIVAEPKIDGISASLIYTNGELTIGSTRGNGYEGEDITENIKVVNGVPKKLKLNDCPALLEIRGEVYMKHNEFARLNKIQNKLGKPLYANPRNSAAGSLRQLDSKVTAERNLNFFAYAWGSSSNYFSFSQWEARKKLKELGFSLNEPSKLCRTSDEVLNYYYEVIDMRSTLNFDIDGVVYKLNNIEWQNKIGARTRSPRWAVAHKLPAEKGHTIIEGIEIQVGRTGSLTPVARLKPINIGGVIITNASLHNSHEIEKKDIRLGDTVLVQRAGDVIPQVLEVIVSKRKKESKKYIFPNKCPKCGSETFSEILDNGENEKTIRCAGGIVCSSQVIERLSHFVSLHALNIEGLGEKQIKFFWNKGIIKDFKDIFLLEEKNGKDFPSLSDEQGWGEQSVLNLFSSIKNSMNVEMDRLIYALGIRHVGLQTAKLLAGFYKETNYFIDQMILAKDKDNQAYNDIVSIEGVGPKIVHSIVTFFEKKENIILVKELVGQLNINFGNSIDISTPLNNKIFVFTGTLEKITRNEAKKTVEKLGAKISNSVSNKTDYLVAGSSPGSKYNKAKEISVKILKEEGFFKLINKFN